MAGRKSQIGNISLFIVKQDYSLYVDDIKLAGKKQNLDPMWKLLNEEVVSALSAACIAYKCMCTRERSRVTLFSWPFWLATFFFFFFFKRIFIAKWRWRVRLALTRAWSYRCTYPAVSPRELTGTAALMHGIPPGARGGIQILGKVLDGPEVSEDDRDSLCFRSSTRWSMSSTSRLCWFHRGRLWRQSRFHGL